MRQFDKNLVVHTDRQEEEIIETEKSDQTDNRENIEGESLPPYVLPEKSDDIKCLSTGIKSVSVYVVKLFI